MMLNGSGGQQRQHLEKTVSAGIRRLEAQGRKYFTLAELGVPQNMRSPIGRELSKDGFNQILLKLNRCTVVRAWLVERGCTEFCTYEARRELLGNTPAAD